MMGQSNEVISVFEEDEGICGHRWMNGCSHYICLESQAQPSSRLTETLWIVTVESSHLDRTMMNNVAADFENMP